MISSSSSNLTMFFFPQAPLASMRAFGGCSVIVGMAVVVAFWWRFVTVAVPVI